MTYKLYCKQCGKAFETRFPTKLYCDENCKYAATPRSAPRAGKKLGKHLCEMCGAEFEKRCLTSRFCTQLCKTNWKNKNYLERWKSRKTP